jgi:superfamily II DNA or RNA helicase
VRGTIVSATGSGKTITAAACALECFPRGRILVTVPTLDLLVQTAQAWRRVGHRGRMVGVCSLENDPVLASLGVRTTTNPVRLALWAGLGPVVVLATYASLVDREDPDDPTGQGTIPGPLEAALAGGERLYGQRMAGFDLAVVDEAHGTAGDLGRPWAAIHDNARIPAGYRLYLTATPRILAAPRPPAGPGREGREGREVEIASMADDPDGTFGPWIAELGLSEAIERGILAGFEIDVLEIHDPSPVAGESEEARRGRRLALLQTALLEHAARWNLRTVMTFHQRVEEAAVFAEQLPKTAARLYAEDVSDEALAAADGLPVSSIGASFYELEPGRHVPADRVWAAWLCGDHLVSERRAVLRQFANGVDEAGRRVHRAFLASVRVLGEGVDITGERGVEAVCFADTRGSQVEIVQNIGRALRPNPDGSAKVARIIVPVFLQPGEDPAGMIASASYRPLVAVLQGLRAHDERLVEQLASRGLTRGTRKVHVRRDENGRVIGVSGQEHGASEGQEHDGETGGKHGGGSGSVLLHFSSPRDPATIAAFLRTRVYRPESLAWLAGYQALLHWGEENGVSGLCAVPYDTEVKVGVSVFPLGRWVHQQRKLQRAGELDPHRRELLDEAGMVWEPGEEAWERRLAVLRSYRRATGHLAPRQDAVWADPADGTLVRVGQYMANLRRKGAKNGLGKDPGRAARRAAQLAAIDPDWDCPWPLDWQRHYRHLAQLVTRQPGRPDGPSQPGGPDGPGVPGGIPPGILIDGDDISRWLTQQRQPHIWARLMPEQQERLRALGIQPLQQPPGTPAAGRTAKGPNKAQQAFQRGLAALTQWVEREGTRPVPRGHIEEITIDGDEEPVAVKLGVWVSNTKSRRAKLTPEQRDALHKLGINWT